jgi:hypothetical protein
MDFQARLVGQWADQGSLNKRVPSSFLSFLRGRINPVPAGRSAIGVSRIDATSGRAKRPIFAGKCIRE